MAKALCATRACACAREGPHPASALSDSVVLQGLGAAIARATVAGPLAGRVHLAVSPAEIPRLGGPGAAAAQSSRSAGLLAGQRGGVVHLAVPLAVLRGHGPGPTDDAGYRRRQAEGGYNHDLAKRESAPGSRLSSMRFHPIGGGPEDDKDGQ